jgi:hypothetical protein
LLNVTRIITRILSAFYSPNPRVREAAVQVWGMPGCEPSLVCSVVTANPRTHLGQILKAIDKAAAESTQRGDFKHVLKQLLTTTQLLVYKSTMKRMCVSSVCLNSLQDEWGMELQWRPYVLLEASLGQARPGVPPFTLVETHSLKVCL